MKGKCAVCNKSYESHTPKDISTCLSKCGVKTGRTIREALGLARKHGVVNRFGMSAYSGDYNIYLTGGEKVVTKEPELILNMAVLHAVDKNYKPEPEPKPKPEPTPSPVANKVQE